MKNTPSIDMRECYLSPKITVIELSFERGIAASADYTQTGNLELGEEYNL